MAGHDDLKKALGSTDAAVLKLRRVATKAAAPKTDMSQHVKPPPAQQSGGWFGCCATRPGGATP